MNFVKLNMIQAQMLNSFKGIINPGKLQNPSILTRNYHGASTGINRDYNPNKPNTVYRDPVRQVFISQSNDVFTNLALEDWLYKNHDFDHKSLLLIWQNNPCVVIGRHQNPWTEANVPFTRHTNTKLARRNSGGGTVYHDMGNLNCTFFTRKSGYDRRRNLDIVSKAIQSVSNLINVRVNERDDIVVNAGLDPKEDRKVGVESRATQSVRVPVKNLQKYDPTVNVNQLQEAVGYQFLRTNVDGIDEGREGLQNTRGFQLIRPDEQWFPGIDKTREEFESFNWIFGRTPKFKVTQAFNVPEKLIFNGLHTTENFTKDTEGKEQIVTDSDASAKIQIELEINSGVVELVKIQQQPYVGFLRPNADSSLASAIQGEHFGPHLPEIMRNRIKDQPAFEDCDEATQEFLAECVDKMIGNFA